MYPAFKNNKDFEWGMLETLTSKMATQIWQNVNLKKWSGSAHWRIM